MKIIRNNLIPTKGFAAINLFGILFARKEVKITNIILNHEAIHTAQMKEMLYIFFYLWYIIEWLLKLIITRNSLKAYHAISFEMEAYQNMKNPDYLKKRKRYSFIKYL